MNDPYMPERERMVAHQLESRGIRDPRILEAFRRVPRHEFVPADLVSKAYTDNPLPIGERQTISQPFMVAVMTQLAEIEPGQKVLELGTGSGYQTAIIAELGAVVYSVERIPELQHSAAERLARLGYSDVQLMVANGTLGWPEHAPYDAIIVTAGAPDVPQPLLDQLAVGGRLVIPVEEDLAQVLLVVRRTPEGFEYRRGERCTFVPLIGEHGWKNS